MPKFTLVAPRDMWEEIRLTLEPVPHGNDVWFRELKPAEMQKYPLDIDNNSAHWIYEVGIQYEGTATREQISLFEHRLQTKWPYVRAEREPPLWFEPTTRNLDVHRHTT